MAPRIAPDLVDHVRSQLAAKRLPAFTCTDGEIRTELLAQLEQRSRLQVPLPRVLEAALRALLAEAPDVATAAFAKILRDVWKAAFLQYGIDVADEAADQLHRRWSRPATIDVHDNRIIP